MLIVSSFALREGGGGKGREEGRVRVVFEGAFLCLGYGNEIVLINFSLEVSCNWGIWML